MRTLFLCPFICVCAKFVVSLQRKINPLAPTAYRSGDIFYIQSFGNEALFFVSIKVQIFCRCWKKERFICIIQKKVVPLQA